MVDKADLNDWISEPYQMRCGSAEAESRKYWLYEDKSGRRYLVADQPNSADNIYVEGDQGSDGFSGRTLTFPLVTGGEIRLKGPWHTNSEDLFKNTGIDVCSKHLTFVVVGLGRGTIQPGWRMVIREVIYKDEQPVMGRYDRGDTIAQKVANERGKTVFMYKRSTDGSICCPVHPNSKGESHDTE